MSAEIKLILSVEGRYSNPFSPPSHSSLHYQLAWYCSSCGEVYARRFIIGKSAPWYFDYGTCLECFRKEKPAPGWWQFFRWISEVHPQDSENLPIEILAEEFMFNYDALLGVYDERSGTTDYGPRRLPTYCLASRAEDSLTGR